MLDRSILRYSSLVSAVVLGMVAFPPSADAQRQRTLERFLIMPAIPDDLADTDYVIKLVEEVRARLEGRFRTQVLILSTELYCEALEASGFDCSFIPDENSARQLAAFLRADSYTVSAFSRNSQPRLTIRMVDTGRSGISGSVTVIGETADIEAKDLAKAVADTLRNQVRAAENARGCYERRDRADHRGARERADRVFRDYPNHPSAAQCVADVFVATNQPPDSLIWAYLKVTAGDPQNDRGWSELARNYLAIGDTVSAIESFQSRLAGAPSDMDLRLQVVRMWQDSEEYDRALGIVDGGLELDPTNADLIRLRARLCLSAQDWVCAVDAFGVWYDSDPQQASDSMFFVQVLGVAEFANDSSALFQWTEDAVEHFPNSLSFWRRWTSLLSTTDDDEALLHAYERLNELNPGQARTMLAYASKLVETVVIDTAVPLDTATLAIADSIVRVVEEMEGEEANIRRLIAAFYYNPGQALARAQYHPELAMQWLDRAIDFDATGQLTVPASFFYGFMTYMHLGGRFEAVRDAETCELSQEFDRLAKLGVERMTAGASVSPGTAEQLMPGLQQISDIGTQFVERDCLGN